jgi:hypothetical protein
MKLDQKSKVKDGSGESDGEVSGGLDFRLMTFALLQFHDTVNTLLCAGDSGAVGGEGDGPGGDAGGATGDEQTPAESLEAPKLEGRW